MIAGEDTITWKMLWGNPETQKAVENLKKKGISDDEIHDLLQQILALPTLHQSLVSESPENRDKRRKLMADNIKELAHKMELDQDAKHISIPDKIPLSPTREKHVLIPLTDILIEAADYIVNRKTIDDSYAEFLKGKTTTRNYLENFVRREVARLLLKLLNNPTESPRADAARLCNAILNTSTITSENMKDTFDYLRKGGN